MSEIRVAPRLDIALLDPLSFADEIGPIVASFSGLRFGWNTTASARVRVDGSLHFLLDVLRPTHIAGPDVLPIVSRWPGIVGVRRTATSVSDDLVFVARDGTQRSVPMRPAAYVAALLRTRGAWPAAMVSDDATAHDTYLREVAALFEDLTSADLDFLRELP